MRIVNLNIFLSCFLVLMFPFQPLFLSMTLETEWSLFTIRFKPPLETIVPNKSKMVKFYGTFVNKIIDDIYSSLTSVVVKHWRSMRPQLKFIIRKLQMRMESLRREPWHEENAGTIKDFKIQTGSQTQIDSVWDPRSRTNIPLLFWFWSHALSLFLLQG